MSAPVSIQIVPVEMAMPSIAACTSSVAGSFHRNESALATIAHANRWTHPQNRMTGEHSV